MRTNESSLFVGLTLTIFFCLLWIPIVPNDPMYRWPGVLAIIGIIFLAGLKNIPTQHAAVLKIFGKRWNILFYEGWCWIPLFASIEIVDARKKEVDVPIIKAFSKTDRVEMEVDIWAWWEVFDPVRYLNLENPEKIATEAVISKCTEQGLRFIKDHTSNQALGAEKDLQQTIQDEIGEELQEYGIRVTHIDIRSILPAKGVREELAEDKKKEIKVKRFKKSLAQIKKGAPGVTDDTLVNTAQVVEGTVEKKIEEKKTTFKLDVEPDILKLVAEFLPKKKNGGKK